MKLDGFRSIQISTLSLNHHAKKGKGKGNSNQHSYLADRLEKVEIRQLQSAPALQHPMIALQPSQAGPSTTTIAFIKLNSVTYVSKSTNLPASAYTGTPSKLGPNTLQRAHSLAQRIGVIQTPENLRALDALREHWKFVKSLTLYKEVLLAEQLAMPPPALSSLKIVKIDGDE